MGDDQTPASPDTPPTPPSAPDPVTPPPVSEPYPSIGYASVVNGPGRPEQSGSIHIAGADHIDGSSDSSITESGDMDTSAE